MLESESSFESNIVGSELEGGGGEDETDPPPPLDVNLEDEPAILSESRNLTFYSNETVHLPCLVRKTLNTVVIWNQCEDPDCVHLRNPLTINKGNFIEDLRFRVLSELPVTSSSIVDSQNNDQSIITVKRDQISVSRNIAVIKTAPAPATPQPPVPSNNVVAPSPIDDQTTGLSAWTLEIRRFGKLDEGCYQCQLNSFRVKTIYYCLKLQSK